MSGELVLENGEKFIVYAMRHFDKLFHALNYSSAIYRSGPYIRIVYTSEALKQDVEFVYDFVRSDRVYYQIEVSFIKRGMSGSKKTRIEPLSYFENRLEPTTMESFMALLSELFHRYLMPVLQGGRAV